MSLQDKVVVVTGASSGIGAMAAQMLSERGAIVVLAARSLDKLEQVALNLKSPYRLVKMDVGNDASVESGFKDIFAKFGRVDCLLNNAGYGKFEYLDRMPTSEFAEMMNVNYVGMVRCTQAVLPAMKSVRSGRIVNVASIAGKIGTAKSTAYTATKHAVIGFSSALRQEVREYGITVSTINPGPIDTEFFKIADPGGGYVQNVRWMMLKPERVARAMVQAVEKGTLEINLPWIAGVGTKWYHMFPRLADRLTYKMMNKK
ncbi:SDR family NAD(P)-dependent oxidoreductase [Paenibacillus sanguinis]|uniref:SDR family NAD(P)-dependent oxidoreductase n=1 Tax=Paenibacillus sanguinis TaxID=225906 RepID=UPI00037EF8D9|nr:SDR family NAD(P)-dependent oxidoreductase [Paenibacillus sanguinis]